MKVPNQIQVSIQVSKQVSIQVPNIKSSKNSKRIIGMIWGVITLKMPTKQLYNKSRRLMWCDNPVFTGFYHFKCDNMDYIVNYGSKFLTVSISALFYIYIVYFINS